MTKFNSKYTSRKISPAQYLAERISEHKADIDQVELVKYFWKLPQWKVYYQQQLIAAQTLLRLYDLEAIIKALRSKEGRRIYSLRSNMIDPLIKKEQRILELKRAEQEKEKVEVVSVLSKPRPHIVKKTKLSMLKELDE